MVYVVSGPDGIHCVTARRDLAQFIREGNGEDEYYYDEYAVIEDMDDAEGYVPEPERAEPDGEAPQQGDFGACASCDAPTLRRNDEGGYQCMGCQAGEPPQNAP